MVPKGTDSTVSGSLWQTVDCCSDSPGRARQTLGVPGSRRGWSPCMSRASGSGEEPSRPRLCLGGRGIRGDWCTTVFNRPGVAGAVLQTAS